MKIHEAIRDIRKQNKISQKSLAEEIGVSHITISNFELGKSIGSETLLKIIMYFDIEINLVLKDTIKRIHY